MNNKPWIEDQTYPVTDWADEVIANMTRLGYWEWVDTRKGVTRAASQAPSILKELLARTTRTETRLCKLMEFLNIDPGQPEGYRGERS